jgi:GTP-binding protein
VVTKCDKLSKNEQAKQKGIIAAAIKRDKGMMLPFSALSKEGRDGIWNEIGRVLEIQLKPDGSAPSPKLAQPATGIHSPNEAGEDKQQDTPL